MNTKRILLTAFSIAAFTVGCKPSGDRADSGMTNDTSAQLEQVKKETAEAAESTKDYAYAQKEEFVTSMRAEVNRLKEELDKISAKVEASTDPKKPENQAKIQALKTKLAELDAQLDKAKDATESTWNDVKSGFKKGYEEVKESFKDARQWVSDKIAP